MEDIETEHRFAQFAKSELFFLLSNSDCDQLLQKAHQQHVANPLHTGPWSHILTSTRRAGHSQDTRAHHGYHQPALCSNSSCGSVLFNTQICALNNQIGIITHILQRGKQSQQCKATRRCSSCNQRQKAEKAQGAMCTASIAVPLCCLPGRAQQLRPARLLAGTCFKEPLAPCPVFKDMALV